MTVTLQATVVFTYKANPNHYPDSNPIKMAEVDQETFGDDSITLQDHLDNADYDVTVEVVEVTDSQGRAQ